MNLLTSENLRQRIDQGNVATYLDAAKELRPDDPERRQARVSYLSTYTVDQLVPFFAVEAACLGFAVDSYLAPFNSVQQELLNPSSGCHAHQSDVLFIAQLLEDVCPRLANDFLDLGAEQVEQQIQKLVADQVSILSKFRETSAAAIVVHNFALPTNAALGIYEPLANVSQTQAIRRLNESLTRELGKIPGVYVLDYDRICAEVGYRQSIDQRMWYWGRAPMSEHLLPPLARAQAACLNAVLGSPRKCLVVDLDNTLWGGVLGEDGVAGIQLGHSFPGNVYRAIQQSILQLYRRGVILAINSKNNQADVEEAFRNHPDMILKLDHFASCQINWQPKPENMMSIADELNIGIDSLVFLDDNPAECALMEQMVPEVLVFAGFDSAGKADPLKALNQLNETRVFDRLSFSEEDRHRGAIYQQQAARRRMERSAASLQDFLFGLEMRVDITEVDEFGFPRLAELIKKTNQFNLTTRRHSSGELSAMRDDPHWGVFTMRVIDRFGDNGIVGIAIVHLDEQTAVIDTFLLSCRVIGRNVETALLAHVAEWAKSRGAECLVGEFIPTAKNRPAADFYQRHGFTSLGEVDQGTTRWNLPLGNIPFQWPIYIDVVMDIDVDLDASAAQAAGDNVDEERVYRTVAAVLGVDAGTLSPESSPDTVSSWDSLNHLNLVMALESEFDRRLSPQDSMELHDVGSVLRVLNKSDSAPAADFLFTDCLQEHVPELKRFIAEAYGADYVLGVNDDYFQWQFAESPVSKGKDYHIRLAILDSKVVGCLGYVPTEINVGGRILNGCWLANWMVGEQQRKMGLGPLLVRDISKEFEVTLALGANADARDIFDRMGWTDFGMLQRYVTVLDQQGAQQLTDGQPLEWPIESTFSPTESDLQIARVPQFDDDATQLWDRLWGARLDTAGTRRTAAFLNWRYARHSQFEYRMFEARNADGLQGFAVYRVEQARDSQLRVGRIVELVGDDGSEDLLLHSMLSDARQAGAIAADYFCGGDQLGPLMARHGFLPGDAPPAQQIPILYQPIDRRRAGIRFLADLQNIPEADQVKSWYVCKADGDQDRPN